VSNAAGSRHRNPRPRPNVDPIGAVEAAQGAVVGIAQRDDQRLLASIAIEPWLMSFERDPDNVTVGAARFNVAPFRRLSASS